MRNNTRALKKVWKNKICEFLIAKYVGTKKNALKQCENAKTCWKTIRIFTWIFELVEWKTHINCSTVGEFVPHIFVCLPHQKLSVRIRAPKAGKRKKVSIQVLKDCWHSKLNISVCKFGLCYIKFKYRDCSRMLVRIARGRSRWHSHPWRWW